MNLRNAGPAMVRLIRNLSGWKTNRKIVVIESDDWGSIRMPSHEVLNRFIRKGYSLLQTQYNRLDGLENNDDLIQLLDVLSQHKDCFGKPACITANTIMANPDFDRIKESGYQSYYYEHFKETLTRYPHHDRVFDLHVQGNKLGMLQHQFHGREHLNVARWMKALQRKDAAVLYAFDQKTTYSGTDDYNYMEALDWDDPTETVSLSEIVKSGLLSFEETFGYRSQSFIAPCYTWDVALNKTLSNAGIKYVQGVHYQYIPRGGFNNYKKVSWSMGQRNGTLIHLVRNCFFEPSLVAKPDWVDYTLASVRDAFRLNKPAVLCAHRINFMGSIDAKNRKQNLLLLDQLLTAITNRWPEIEFMSSDQLGATIEKDLNPI